MSNEELINEAFKAMKNAYAPYSKYHVGACVLCKDGKTFYGANIENASYGATNCGERSAVFAAYSCGYRKEDIEAIAIVTDGERLGTPCGICRQVLSELLKQDTDEASVIAAMQARFDAPAELIAEDVRHVLSELRRIDALEE